MLNSSALNSSALNSIPSSGGTTATCETELTLLEANGAAHTASIGYGETAVHIPTQTGYATPPLTGDGVTALPTLVQAGVCVVPLVAYVETSLTTLSSWGEAAPTGNYGGVSLGLIDGYGEAESVNLITGQASLKLKVAGSTSPFRFGIGSFVLPTLVWSGYSGSASTATIAVSLPSMRAGGAAINPSLCAGNASFPLPQGSGQANVGSLAYGVTETIALQSIATVDNPALVSGDTRIRLLSTGETVRSQWGSVSTVAPLFQCNGYADGLSPPATATTALSGLVAQCFAATAVNVVGAMDAPKILVAGEGSVANFGQSAAAIPSLIVHGVAHNAAHCEAACLMPALHVEGLATTGEEPIADLSFSRGCVGALPTVQPSAIYPLHYERCA